MKKCVCVFLTVLLVLCIFPEVRAESVKARPSVNGALHLEGTCLVGESGGAVDLTGISTHGLTYYPEFINESLFAQISSEWDCNLIRLAMYSDIYCLGKKQKNTSCDLMIRGIDAAIESDMYVLVDWHILSDHDPNENKAQAIAFFDRISSEYGDAPNVLYEICNEPNGDTTWADVKQYALSVIPVIKANDPDAVIIVGTPDYDTDLASVYEDPIAGYDNILYTYHFYANSHHEENRAFLKRYLDLGLPVFITECGIVEADGDGGYNYEEAEAWFTLLGEYHLGYAVWSLSDKNETSAMIKITAGKSSGLKDGDLTPCGQYVKAMLQGKALSGIPAGINSKKSFGELWHGSMAFSYGILAASALVLLTAVLLIASAFRKKTRSYGELLRSTGTKSVPLRENNRRGKAALVVSLFTSVVYLAWRVFFTLPFMYGAIPAVLSVILLSVELLGFAESCVHYSGMLKLRKYPLPQIEPAEYPDVDVFVATYNEPPEVLRKTLTGCMRMRYPDRSKVHIYLCDDKRRAEMRELAAELGVCYFDRPDNSGAKAGNLNAAMARTSSPYIVTFDADMIPREEFLLKTVPYYVDAEKRNAALPEDRRMPLGLLQTPQAFYNPDVFQHNLYAERRIPNEQDFFYRTIEAAKTSSNSVIYGGSNTVLSRRALEDIGGFYTGSITEDFATGMLIEAKGYVSLGLSEPLASGLAPATFGEHIRQRTRWGRGVILTAKKLKIAANKNLTPAQKLSYLSSVVYWYSSLKNWVYILSPLLFAVFGVPMLLCGWQQILVFWLPMFLSQSLALRLVSGGSVSAKRSGIQETAVMPFLLLPVVKETLGISLSTFHVTEKKAGAGKRKRDFSALLPFLILILLSCAGIARVCVLLAVRKDPGLVAVLYWLFRNLYFLLMCLFLLDGRDGDGENVTVIDTEPISVHYGGTELSGVTTRLTEHSLSVFIDETRNIRLGEGIALKLDGIPLSGTVVSVKESANPSVPSVYTVEILDFGGRRDDYLHVLYNRIPTLPQSLKRDFGFFTDLWVNLVKHLSAQLKY